MTADGAPAWRRTALVRAVMYLVLWLMIAGYDAADLPVGIITACLATAASLRLMPPTRIRLRPARTLRFAMNFFWQAVSSGIQVAVLALRPSLPLHLGFVRYRMRLPADDRRYAFCALASLLPGTMPTGFGKDGAVIIHALDIERPVAADLATEETLFRGMLADE